MDYKVYFANAGVPATGLSLTWETLEDLDGNDVGSPPAFIEIGGGWYKFSLTPTEELVGVVDGSGTLADADRYVPVDFTPDDYGLTDLLDAIVKGSQTLDPSGDTLTLKRRDGSTVLVTFDLVKTTESIGAYKERTPQ